MSVYSDLVPLCIVYIMSPNRSIDNLPGCLLSRFIDNRNVNVKRATVPPDLPVLIKKNQIK